MCSNLSYVGGAFKMRGNWRIQSDLLKKKFADLTDADLEFTDGEEKKLLRKLEIRLNKKREEIIEIIKSFQPEKKRMVFTRSGNNPK
jgi:hypothetical protein